MTSSTIWHCLTDSTEGNDYDVFIRSESRPTDKQIVKAIHKSYAGEFSQHIDEDIADLELLAYKINDDIVNVEEL